MNSLICAILNLPRRATSFGESNQDHDDVATTSAAMLLAGVLLLAGCTSRPPAMTAPEIDPAQAADAALEAYDVDGDGALNDRELAACPGVLSAKYVYDTDGNQQVSKEELVARMSHWKSGPSFMTLDCQVTLDGRPLPGAEVRYSPESYLADWLPSASGTTDGAGMAAIGISAEELPSSHQRLRALNAGVYKVEITHSSASIPSKYNTNTILGREVSKETRAMPMEKFVLTRK